MQDSWLNKASIYDRRDISLSVYALSAEVEIPKVNSENSGINTRSHLCEKVLFQQVHSCDQGKTSIPLFNSTTITSVSVSKIHMSVPRGRDTETNDISQLHWRQNNMRLDFVAGVIASVFTVVSADSLIVDQWCGGNGCEYRYPRFKTCCGTFTQIESSDGCHGGGDVPELRQICIDSANERLHFIFNGQGKRCMRVRYKEQYWDGCGAGSCVRWTYDEIGCSWWMERLISTRG